MLHFLALVALLLHYSEAYYPNAQQQYSSQHGSYNNQNGNFHRYNSNNNNVQHNIHNNHILSKTDDRRNALHNNNNPSLVINLPKIFWGDFEYVPTQDGYRFSYQLIDGTRRTEIGRIPNSGDSNIYKSDRRATAERTTLRMRAREYAKNRKLSPKSLQSLAG